jgi:hypothetical protein
VSGHCGIPGSENTEELSRQIASSSPLVDPEPALGVPSCAAGEKIQYWTESQHCIALNKLPGHKYNKCFINRPYKTRTKDLLKFKQVSFEKGDCVP